MGAVARRTLAVLLVAALGAFAAPSAVAAAHGRVSRVSNPPRTVPARLTLKIRASAARVAVYASPARARGVSGAVRLVRSAKPRRGTITVAVPGRLAFGAYYVVVCPAAGAGTCAASKTQMLKAPSATSLPAPVSAAPVDETAQASSATIGSAGGTLTATAADGTKFTLTLPAGSVPDGTQITMTPVSSIGGPSSVGKLIAGVELAPDGLALYRGGTLTITPAHALSNANQAAYSYSGTGTDLHQELLLPTRAIEIPLAHFSGWDVVQPPPPGGLPSPTGSTILDFYQLLIAEDMATVRNGTQSEDAAYDQARLWLGDAYNDVMRDEVPPGLSDDTAAHQAIKDLLTIARDTDILGGHGESTFQAEQPTIMKLLAGVWNRAQQDCVSTHNLYDVSKILDVDRNEQLVNGGNGPGVDNDLSCLKFEVDLDSREDVNAGSGGSGSWQYEYKAQATITPDATEADQYLDGGGAGSFAVASGTISGDGVNTTLQSGTGDIFKVDKFTIPDSPDDHSPPVITLEVGTPTESYSYDDTTDGDSGTYTDHQWLSIFSQFNPPQSGTYTFTLTNNGANATVATGTFTGTVPDGSADEVTSIDVIHTPPAPPRQ
jgi:hypothetical protein